jgi:hypothetical protein
VAAESVGERANKIKAQSGQERLIKASLERVCASERNLHECLNSSRLDIKLLLEEIVVDNFTELRGSCTK